MGSSYFITLNILSEIPTDLLNPLKWKNDATSFSELLCILTWKFEIILNINILVSALEGFIIIFTNI